MNPIFVASVACCRSRMDRMAQPTKMMNSLPHDDGNRGRKPGTVPYSPNKLLWDFVDAFP